MREVYLRPAQKLLICLVAATLTLLWGELLSDILAKKPESVSALAGDGSRIVVKRASVRLKTVDLNEQVRNMRVVVDAARLASEKCGSPTVLSADDCIDAFYDEKYHLGKALLPALEQLSALPVHAREVSFDVIEVGADGIARLKAQSQRTYCFDRELSPTDALLWAEAIKPVSAHAIPAQISRELCRAYAGF